MSNSLEQHKSSKEELKRVEDMLTEKQKYSLKEGALFELYGAIDPKIIEIENVQTLSKVIDENLRKKFPNSFEIFDKISIKKFQDQLKVIYKHNHEALDYILKEINNILHSPFNKKESKGEQLYYITSFLKGRLLDKENIKSDIQNILHKKKILVLGDDIGSLSEILNHNGAESYGIENDKSKVYIAHSGILSENKQPQNQVLLGDLKDIANAESALFRKLKGLGPFDMIFSSAVFNYDSGLDESIVGKSPNISDPEVLLQILNFRENFRENSNELLKDDGFHLHTNVDASIFLLSEKEDRAYDRYTLPIKIAKIKK